MKIGAKLGLWTAPPVLAAMALLGWWAAYVLTNEIQRSASRHMHAVLTHFMARHMGHHYELLRQNRLHKEVSFVQAYQRISAESASRVQLPQDSHILVLNENGEFVFAVPSMPSADMADPAWGKIAGAIARGSQTSYSGHVPGPDHGCYYVAARFVPWRWVVFYAASDAGIRTAEHSIVKAAIAISGACAAFLFITVFLVSKKIILSPVREIEAAAGTMAAGNPAGLMTVSSNDELGSLSRSLEAMFAKIEKHRAEQATWQARLERQIQAKTSHLTREIDKRKRAQARIATALKEKDVLLGEIHHRVKNNLQVVCSLLAMQAQRITDPDVAARFDESHRRIQSIAAVHEMLYRTDDFSAVDLGAYFRTIADNLAGFHRGLSNRAALEVEVDTIAVDMQTAVPCGLILNELVTNALEHAFAGRKAGRVRLSLKRRGGGRIELAVCDDGIGLPRGVDFQNTTSLGLYLVRILAEDQLGGRIEVDRAAGTRFAVTFTPTPRGGHPATPPEGEENETSGNPCC